MIKFNYNLKNKLDIMDLENNNTSEIIDNEKINTEGIEKYLDSFEGKSEKFIEDRENVLKALTYYEENDNIDEDIDLVFKNGKYYTVNENGITSVKGYTAEEFIKEFGEKEKSLLEKGEELYDSLFGGKEEKNSLQEEYFNLELVELYNLQEKYSNQLSENITEEQKDFLNKEIVKIQEIIDKKEQNYEMPPKK